MLLKEMKNKNLEYLQGLYNSWLDDLENAPSGKEMMSIISCEDNLINDINIITDYDYEREQYVMNLLINFIKVSEDNCKHGLFAWPILYLDIERDDEQILKEVDEAYCLYLSIAIQTVTQGFLNLFSWEDFGDIFMETIRKYECDDLCCKEPSLYINECNKVKKVF